MKTIKPQKLGVLHRTYEAAGRLEMCVPTRERRLHPSRRLS